MALTPLNDSFLAFFFRLLAFPAILSIRFSFRVLMGRLFHLIRLLAYLLLNILKETAH